MNVERLERSLFTYQITLGGDEVKALHDLITVHDQMCGQHMLDLRRALREACPDGLLRRW